MTTWTTSGDNFKELKCVMENDGGVERVLLRVFPDGDVSMWVDDEFNDTIMSWADYAEWQYPDTYYESLAAYKRGEGKSVREYFGVTP